MLSATWQQAVSREGWGDSPPFCVFLHIQSLGSFCVFQLAGAEPEFWQLKLPCSAAALDWRSLIDGSPLCSACSCSVVRIILYFQCYNRVSRKIVECIFLLIDSFFLKCCKRQSKNVHSVLCKKEGVLPCSPAYLFPQNTVSLKKSQHIFPRNLLQVMSLNLEEWGNSSSFLPLSAGQLVPVMAALAQSSRTWPGKTESLFLRLRNSNAIFCLKTNSKEKMGHIHSECSSILGGRLGLRHVDENVTHVLQLLPLSTPANPSACPSYPRVSGQHT